MAQDLCRAPGRHCGPDTRGDPQPILLRPIDDLAWEQVARSYGYELDDDVERQHAARLVRAMINQFADIGR